MKKNYIIFIVLLIVVLLGLYYNGFFENFEGQKRLRKRDGSGILSALKPNVQNKGTRNTRIGGGQRGIAF